MEEMFTDNETDLADEVVFNKFGSAINTIVKVHVKRADGEKCPRCWHYTTDVGQVAEHAELCGRCVTNVAGDGEKRNFA